MNWLGDLIQNEINKRQTILDLGCGIMQATDGLKNYILGVDIWPKYLDYIKYKFPTVKLSMEETDRFMDKSYDVVICLDVVEHLEYDLALKVIDECKRIAREKVIIYTPSVHKDNSSAEKNAWDMGECIHQKHLCVISKGDFLDRGFTVEDPANDQSHLAIWSR